MLNLKDLGDVILSFETSLWVVILLSWNSIVPQVISLTYFGGQLFKQTTALTLDFFLKIYQILSIPLILVYKLVQISLLLVLWPVKQILFPGGLFAFHILRHLLVEPGLLCIRTLFYALFGIPLRPLCYLLGIDDLSTEHIMELKPQLEYFVVTTIHYIVASLMIGAITGIITGYNMVFTRYILGGAFAKPLYRSKGDISTPVTSLGEAYEEARTQKRQRERKLTRYKENAFLSQGENLDLSTQELDHPVKHVIDNNTDRNKLKHSSTDQENILGKQDKHLLPSEEEPSSKESTVRFEGDQRIHATPTIAGTDLFEQTESASDSERDDVYHNAKINESESCSEKSKINAFPEKEIKEEYPTRFSEEPSQRVESTQRDKSETSITKDDIFSLVGDVGDDDKTMNTQVSFTEKGIKREE